MQICQAVGDQQQGLTVIAKTLQLDLLEFCFSQQFILLI